MKVIIYALAIMGLSLMSCNSIQIKLDKVGSELEYAEKHKNELTAKEWSNLALMIEELEGDFELNRDKYTTEQIKEFGTIQGRYTALKIKKGINDFQESINEVGSQMQGFIEGFRKDTI